MSQNSQISGKIQKSVAPIIISRFLLSLTSHATRRIDRSIGVFLRMRVCIIVIFSNSFVSNKIGLHITKFIFTFN